MYASCLKLSMMTMSVRPFVLSLFFVNVNYFQTFW